ncbi:DUF1127 domain-containing protein [Sulfitobacter sp. M57]|uniref:DUF1127 domain-containing protein n=1 Tax=unclassified Sulfitobacter TaxID=196795 RepID=UPI0023E2642B|nr:MULTISPECIES: DUF1127 domain-containing protein [unclassified Sulfitobacter]MDF3412944.1 DUF1127 domain-containing protein [Sulfitobacter sp. KE5]MDF3421772.1 DUF1127 domain-containing protein [Sulfitobacter sp. KE43]MDF3431493.1 DUF1127 domain-containing protein [Sulfitobacter sp. KE42]MDF3457134.1 DUF1127 domain-containing protein [Sulfitobacter sp. S74]MDF3461037.1 DUF1127 domain-containing protein [Sulfitobacter sp. Ks18]
MATLDTTRTAFGSTSAVSSFITRSFATLAAWNDARITRSALSSLSDRELEDIGLVRGDIDAVAQPNFFR